jgi:hypothetical protein
VLYAKIDTALDKQVLNFNLKSMEMDIPAEVCNIKNVSVNKIIGRYQQTFSDNTN